MSAVSKQEIREQLWRVGELSWLLDVNQKAMRSLYKESKHKVQTWLLARRSGKSYALCVLALEQCFKKPGSIVKFLSPTKMQVMTNLRPLFKQILESCPQDIKPEFRGKDFIYYFPNGSEIQLAGTDAGHAEKLRGGDADIGIVDEAGSCSDLDYIVKSILLPTTLITRGRIILASTPPKEAEHDFLHFIEEAELRGSLVKKTIYDNPRITKEQVKELIEEVGGEFTDAARRELFCELIKDSTTSVIPEFTIELEKEITKEWDQPAYFDPVVAMDFGGKDLTVALFGYFDFKNDKIIIEDELVLDFAKQDVTIELLAKQIEQKEIELWTNKITGEVLKPNRVSDINYMVMKEIQKYSEYRVNFKATKKDDKDAALSMVRILFGNKKLIIDPRCVTLLRHLKNVKWSANKKTFARSPENGHYDAVDALIYLVRSINVRKNPYPMGYEMNLKTDAFFSNGVTPINHNRNLEVYKKLFNVKRR
jgi:hypothetical protein